MRAASLRARQLQSNPSEANDDLLTLFGDCLLRISKSSNESTSNLASWQDVLNMRLKTVESTKPGHEEVGIEVDDGRRVWGGDE